MASMLARSLGTAALPLVLARPLGPSKVQVARGALPFAGAKEFVEQGRQDAGEAGSDHAPAGIILG
jgi:hypothetical protein